MLGSSDKGIGIMNRDVNATQQWIYRDDYLEITAIGLRASKDDGIILHNFADALKLVFNEYKILKGKEQHALQKLQ